MHLMLPPSPAHSMIISDHGSSHVTTARLHVELRARAGVLMMPLSSDVSRMFDDENLDRPRSNDSGIRFGAVQTRVKRNS